MAFAQIGNEVPGEMNSQEIFDVYREFEFKVSYDFKRLVFLAPRNGDVNLEQMLEEVYNTNGYQAHKLAFHGEMPSHIHIRYEDETYADRAIKYFKEESSMQGGKISAMKVLDLLASIYATEHTSRRFPAWTLTIVDIEGTVQHTSPLSKDVVSSLLRKFGEPRIFTYHFGQTTANHVQALFSSMAEALGASIAHGTWMKRDQFESPRFRYRVRLIGSDKEYEVMKQFSRVNSHAVFEMDYFIGSDLGNFSDPKESPFIPQNRSYRPRSYTNTSQNRNRMNDYSRRGHHHRNRMMRENPNN